MMPDNQPPQRPLPVAVYFLGLKPELKDGRYPTQRRCTCPNQPEIFVTVSGGEITEAACPICQRQYVVLVEQGEFWPVPPENIIFGGGA